MCCASSVCASFGGAEGAGHEANGSQANAVHRPPAEPVSEAARHRADVAHGFRSLVRPIRSPTDRRVRSLDVPVDGAGPLAGVENGARSYRIRHRRTLYDRVRSPDRHRWPQMGVHPQILRHHRPGGFAFVPPDAGLGGDDGPPRRPRAPSASLVFRAFELARYTAATARIGKALGHARDQAADVRTRGPIPEARLSPGLPATDPLVPSAGSRPAPGPPPPAPGLPRVCGEPVGLAPRALVLHSDACSLGPPVTGWRDLSLHLPACSSELQ